MAVDATGEGTEEGETQGSVLAHAFRLLANAELGSGAVPDEPTEVGRLQARVATLSVLLGIIPRAELSSLGAVAEAWQRRFSGGQPVTAGELRAVARDVLDVKASAVASLLRDQNAALAAALVKLAGTFGSANRSEEPAQLGDDHRAAALCAQGLRKWFDELQFNPRWTEIRSPVPGTRAIRIESIFVELFVIPDEDVLNSGRQESFGRRAVRRMQASKFSVVDIPAMVARTLERCVVIGEPGSGKSTLVQWMARAAYHRQFPDFDAALVVRLGAFASALVRRRHLSLLEFFFESLGDDTDDWPQAARWMRHVAQQGKRFLLLLDGWDEVPLPLRDSVLESIRREEPYFVTIMTSRPSGLPRQLQAEGPVDFYHIAGLAPKAGESLVRNVLRSLGRDDLAEAVLKRIKQDDDFREMATSPFLLELLVRILARTLDQGLALRTLADVYSQIAAWIQEHRPEGAGDTEVLTPEHLRGLQRLSYGLLFEDALPRYVFLHHELTGKLGLLSPDPVIRSRFVNRTDPDFNEFGFLHATFQEYFAGVEASTFTGADLDAFLDRTFRSESRSIVLSFLAGLPGAARWRCQTRSREWLSQRDRFHKTLLAVARLAAAGRWEAGEAEGLTSFLRNELWREVQKDPEGAFAEAAVEALSDLGSRELCRLAHQAGELSTWVLNCIVESVPKSVATEARLDELLTPEWQDYEAFDLRGGATPAELERIRSCLKNPATSKEDRFEAVIHAGAARDRDSVEMLRVLTTNPLEDPGIRQQAIDSLGAIRGRTAVDSLVDLVTGKAGFSEGARTAAMVLRGIEGTEGALDPVARDQILRRLSVLPPSDPYVEQMLTVLEGHPLRDGSEVVFELATRTDVPADVRARAVNVLGSAADRSLVANAVSGIETETSPAVVAALLQLSVARRVPLPMKWLERKIHACRDRVQRHRLLKTYVLALPLAVRKEWEEARRFLDRLANEALTAEPETAEDRAKALVQALTIGSPDIPYFSRSILNQARGVVARFAKSPDLRSEGPVALAVAIIGHFRANAAYKDLRKALDVALQLGKDGDDGAAKTAGRLATTIADTLAELAPGDLLDLPATCEPVNAVLQSRAMRNGWWVFSDRILDAEGVEIANRTGTVEKPEDQPALSALEELIRLLPEEGRKALQSYWFMVDAGGPCAPGDSLASVHRAMTESLDGQFEDDTFQALDRIYPDELPDYNTWRQALSRISRRYQDQDRFRDALSQIGLNLRKRHPKRGPR